MDGWNLFDAGLLERPRLLVYDFGVSVNSGRGRSRCGLLSGDSETALIEDSPSRFSREHDLADRGGLSS